MENYYFAVGITKKNSDCGLKNYNTDKCIAAYSWSFRHREATSHQEYNSPRQFLLYHWPIQNHIHASSTCKTHDTALGMTTLLLSLRLAAAFRYKILI